jgi:hypothetical protein
MENIFVQRKQTILVCVDWRREVHTRARAHTHTHTHTHTPYIQMTEEGHKDWTALHAAASQGHMEIGKEKLKKKKRKKDRTTLHAAASQGRAWIGT